MRPSWSRGLSSGPATDPSTGPSEYGSPFEDLTLSREALNGTLIE